MEKYLDWIIKEEDITNFWLSDGQVKLKATIYPNIEALYCFLKENKIVSTAFSKLSNAYELLTFGVVPNTLSYSEQKDLKVFCTIVEYCSNEKHSVTKTAHAFLSINSTGGNKTHQRAMEKIKEWIRASLPNPRQKMTDYLKHKGLISQNTNLFCEILSKDI